MPRLVAGFVEGLSAPLQTVQTVETVETVEVQTVGVQAVEVEHTLDSIFGVEVPERKRTFGSLFTDTPMPPRRRYDRPQVLGFVDNRSRLAQLRASRRSED